MINTLCQHSCTHIGLLQPHPPLPCIYFPSHVINCIPLDDITGNKRQQQDNKKSELQSTSFISDFITPRLMDVDLYTLPHLTCSTPQPPPPSSGIHSQAVFQSQFFFTVIYDLVTNTSPRVNISIYGKREWIGFNGVAFR